MLVAGLSGRAFADLNSDGMITLSELAEDREKTLVQILGGLRKATPQFVESVAGRLGVSL